MQDDRRRVLVSGAGVAGPVLAYWLRRRGFHPTVVERAPGIRAAGGHAVDLWGAAVDIVERMGILPQVEAARTGNDASSLIRPGRPPVELDVAELASEPSHRAVEIPRDDLTRLLYESGREGVEYVFGDSIREMAQDAEGVTVEFDHAPPRRFSLVVGADGLHSRVRRLAFGEEPRFRRYLGGYIAVASIPNFLGVQGRILNYPEPMRTVYYYHVHQTGDARACFLFRREAEFDYDHRDTAQQQRLLRDAYAGGGWQVPRILDHVADADSFYFDSVSQIRMGALSTGRVTLVGDAGYAPGAGVGGGTSLAVLAAYVLAGELAAADGEPGRGFRDYERALREVVVRSRAIGPALLPRLVSGSRAQIRLGMQAARLLPRLPRRLRGAVSVLPHDALTGLRAIATYPLPDYPEE